MMNLYTQGSFPSLNSVKTHIINGNIDITCHQIQVYTEMIKQLPLFDNLWFMCFIQL